VTWVNASAVLTQYRAQLLACPTVDALFDEANFHYPYFQGGSSETPDSLPACLLQEIPQRRVRYAEGAIPLISGTLKACFYFLVTDAVNAGFCETFARDVILELGQQLNGGLAFSDYEVTLSSDPRPGARAAGDTAQQNTFRAVTITVQYGLSR